MQVNMSEPGTGRSLAEKIEWLIANRWPPGQPPPKTNGDIAKAVSAASGEDLTRTAIWKLRTGRGDNPALKTLKALRAFFRLPDIGYFDDGYRSRPDAAEAAANASRTEPHSG